MILSRRYPELFGGAQTVAAGTEGTASVGDEKPADIQRWEAEGGSSEPAGMTSTSEDAPAETGDEGTATGNESTTASADDAGDSTGAATAAAVAFDFGLLDLSIKKALDEIKKISDRKALDALREAESKGRKRAGVLKAIAAQLAKVSA